LFQSQQILNNSHAPWQISLLTHNLGSSIDLTFPVAGKVESVFPQTIFLAFHRLFPLLLALFFDFKLASQTLTLVQYGVKYLLCAFLLFNPKAIIHRGT